MAVNALVPIGLVFLGCCANNIFLELLVKECPSSGNIITCSQFLLIAVEGFLLTTNCGRVKPVIPLTTYAVMVLMFAVTSVVNNYALNFNISMPLHMIFRAGSLMANLCLGVIILKRRYSLTKYLSVVMITVGIALATLASAGDVGARRRRGEGSEGMDGSEGGEGPQGGEESEGGQGGRKSEGEQVVVAEFLRWLVGIAMLTFALFLSARMGIYQEVVYKTHGKHPSEALFYNHALPLPLLLLLLHKDIHQHIVLFNASDPVALPLVDWWMPKMWLYLLGNVLTQYVCIKSVFVLTSECTSLTVTLVVTLRKFVSLLASILYFNNPFTPQHWVATLFVFGGTFLFADVHTGLYSALGGCQGAAREGRGTVLVGAGAREDAGVKGGKDEKKEK